MQGKKLTQKANYEIQDPDTVLLHNKEYILLFVLLQNLELTSDTVAYAVHFDDSDWIWGI